MTRSSKTAALLLGCAAAAYAIAAWSVRPGFYDGFAPPSPYRWVSPPPSLAAGNQAPLVGHGTDPVVGGSSGAFSAYTGDSQVIVSFVPASFQVSPGQTAVTIRITPEATYPTPNGFTPATNVYLITADAPLVKNALVELEYAQGVPAPSYVYGLPQDGQTWKNLGASQVSAIYSISTRTSFMGYFVGGYAKGAPRPPVSVGGGQVLPIVIAAVILLVLVAGVPLALLRRGRDEDEDEEEA